MERVVLARNQWSLPSTIRAGDLIFTGGMDGHIDPLTNRLQLDAADDPVAQSKNSYGQIVAALNACGADAGAVVRLDHYTQSQSWLKERSSVRASIFGRPAALASTGIAAKMAGLNMLTTAAVATVHARDKEVLLEGAPYGMPNISAVVRGGVLAFLSGVRATLTPQARPCEEETPGALGSQAAVCFSTLRAMLNEVGIPHANLVRLEFFIRDRRRLAEVKERPFASFPAQPPPLAAWHCRLVCAARLR